MHLSSLRLAGTSSSPIVSRRSVSLLGLPLALIAVMGGCSSAGDEVDPSSASSAEITSAGAPGTVTRFPYATTRTESVEVAAVRAPQGFVAAAYSQGNEGGSSCALTISADDGATWSTPYVHHDTHFPIDLNPAVSVDKNGKIYFACLAASDSPYTGQIELASSADEGRTWSAWSVVVPPPVVDGNQGLDDKPSLVADSAGNVYLGYTVVVLDADMNTLRTELWVVTSNDGGGTWNAPVLLSGDRSTSTPGTDGWGPQGSALALDDSGRLLVTWMNYQGAVYFSSSADHGRTFAAPLTVAQDDLDPPVTSLVVDPSGMDLAVVWSKPHSIEAPVRASASRDGGKTWSAPLTLDAIGTLGTLALDPTGGVDLMWTAGVLNTSGTAVDVTTKYAHSSDWLRTMPTSKVLATSVIEQDHYPNLADDIASHIGAYQALVPVTNGDMRALFLSWTQSAGVDGGAPSYTGKLDKALFRASW